MPLECTQARLKQYLVLIQNLCLCSNKPLSKPQEDVLRFGLNFTLAPTKLPLVDTIAAVKEGVKQLDEEDAEDLWNGCVEF